MSEDDVTVCWNLSDLAQDLEVLKTARAGWCSTLGRPQVQDEALSLRFSRGTGGDAAHRGAGEAGETRDHGRERQAGAYGGGLTGKWLRRSARGSRRRRSGLFGLRSWCQRDAQCSDNLVHGRRFLSLGNDSDAGGRAREAVSEEKNRQHLTYDEGNTGAFSEEDTDQASQYGGS